MARRPRRHFISFLFFVSLVLAFVCVLVFAFAVSRLGHRGDKPDCGRGSVGAKEPGRRSRQKKKATPKAYVKRNMEACRPLPAPC